MTIRFAFLLKPIPTAPTGRGTYKLIFLIGSEDISRFEIAFLKTLGDIPLFNHWRCETFLITMNLRTITLAIAVKRACKIGHAIFIAHLLINLINHNDCHNKSLLSCDKFSAPIGVSQSIEVFSITSWERRQDSNLRHLAYEANELPSALLRDI